MKISKLQVVAGAIFLVAGTAAGFSSSVKISILTSVISVVSLFVALWLQVDGDIDSLRRRVTDTEENVIKRISAHNIDWDKRIVADPAWNRISTELLTKTDGIAFVRHGLILNEVGEKLSQSYQYNFHDYYEEYLRIAVLADLILAAESSVLAYTHASKDHLERFWGNKHETISKYYDAHRLAIADKSKKFVLKRVFVIPDDLHKDHPDAFAILLEVITTLLAHEMTHLYELSESAAKRAFQERKIGDLGVEFPPRSFFLADDVCVSEGATKGLPSGYVLFTSKERIRGFADQFTILAQEARPINGAVVEELRRRLITRPSSGVPSIIGQSQP